MATIMHPQLPIEIAILIFLPYFIAVIAAIIYTNKQIKKSDNNVEDKADEDESNSLNYTISA